MTLDYERAGVEAGTAHACNAGAFLVGSTLYADGSRDLLIQTSDNGARIVGNIKTGEAPPAPVV
jgi:hypothetical protein